jgi:hypothetical protein
MTQPEIPSPLCRICGERLQVRNLKQTKKPGFFNKESHWQADTVCQGCGDRDGQNWVVLPSGEVKRTDA